MKFRSAVVVFMSVAFACPGGAEPPTAPLKPSSKWWLDYAPDSCRLARLFGDGKEQILAQFTRYEPSDNLFMVLSGKPLSFATPQSTVKIRFGDSGEFVTASTMVGAAGEKERKVPAIFLQGRLDNLITDTREWKAKAAKLPEGELYWRTRVAPAQESAVSTLTIRLSGRMVVLALGSMGPPMAAMRKCTADLVKEWGLDPDEQARLAEPARPSNYPGDWLRSSDYPMVSLFKGEQAIIAFRLAVDATGAVTGCSVQSSISSDPIFAQRTCALIRQRAKLDPAREADGKPIASYYVNRVRWIIP